MRIRKYSLDFARRTFLENTGKGIVRAGVLGSALTCFMKSGNANGAYPDELNSIDEYTKGRISTGQTISNENVDLVTDLLDPVRALQIEKMGRKLRVVPSIGDIQKLLPVAYVEATLRHRGQGRFDGKGNVVTTSGKPWIGGNPFPEPTSAIEVFAAHTLSWGRHDSSVYVAKEYDLDADGRIQYQYASVWAEMNCVGRTSVPPLPYMPGAEEKLRYQSVFFVEPSDVKGTGYLNIWPYDQSQFPDLYGYIPAFKRVRRFPANQRFEPLIPGSELYLSDAWAAGDPFLTWGAYRIVFRGPFLAAVSDGWNGAHLNWEHQTHGGKHQNLFWDTSVQLVPEAIAVEAQPVGFPRAPVSKKIVWFDARTLLPLAMISYDRQGKPFRYFDCAYARYEDQNGRVLDGNEVYWSWSHFHAFNIQTGKMTRVEQVKSVSGGHTMMVNDPEILRQYLTLSALQRLGA